MTDARSPEDKEDFLAWSIADACEGHLRWKSYASKASRQKEAVRLLSAASIIIKVCLTRIERLRAQLEASQAGEKKPE